MNAQERKTKLEAYDAAGEEPTAELKKFPPKMWTYKPGSERWSIQEVLFHLVDSETNGYIRCRRAVAEPGSPVTAYDQEKWVARLNSHEQDPEDALAVFILLRRINARLLWSLPEEAWAQTFLHPERGPMTLDDWLTIYTAHTPAHIEQMRATHAAWLEAQKGHPPDPGKSLFKSLGGR